MYYSRWEVEGWECHFFQYFPTSPFWQLEIKEKIYAFFEIGHTLFSAHYSAHPPHFCSRDVRLCRYFYLSKLFWLPERILKHLGWQLWCCHLYCHADMLLISSSCSCIQYIVIFLVGIIFVLLWLVLLHFMVGASLQLTPQNLFVRCFNILLAPKHGWKDYFLTQFSWNSSIVQLNACIVRYCARKLHFVVSRSLTF